MSTKTSPPRPVALVTGATDGIGRATARRLARSGWDVVVTGRNEARCSATVDEIRGESPGADVTFLVADLSSMSAVQSLAEQLRARHDRLDLLLLNANSITQEHARTKDGFEQNLAIGYLSRALLIWSLEPLLARTEGAMILSVVGMNLERLDPDEPIKAEGFTSMKALGYWQWAIQMFAREWSARHPEIVMNTYMPGLVKTKILANEPQPMRLIVQIVSFFIGLTVERSSEELTQVIDEIRRERPRDAYYNRTKRKPPRTLKEQPGDGAKLWERTSKWLAPWLSSAR